MTNVIPLRRPTVPSSSRRPRRSVHRPSSPVRIIFDDVSGVHAAVCRHCTESSYTDSVGWLLDWADQHRCDPELAALLAAVCDRGAA